MLTTDELRLKSNAPQIQYHAKLLPLPLQLPLALALALAPSCAIKISSTSSNMSSSSGYAAFVVAFAILTVGLRGCSEVDSANMIVVGFHDLYNG